MRVTRLHTVLDSGVLERDGIRDGVVEVKLSFFRLVLCA